MSVRKKIEEEEEEWKPLTTSGVYKIREKDTVILIPLEEPRAVKQGSAYVLLSKILSWRNNGTPVTDENNEPLENRNVNVYMQIIPGTRILQGIRSGKIKIGETQVKLINKGKLGRTYIYDIFVK